jgi:hypothetical protein
MTTTRSGSRGAGPVGLRARLAGAGCAVGLLAAGCATAPRPHAAVEAGFLGARDGTLDGNARVRVAGPFYEKQQAADGKSFVAVRPFYSSASDPTNRMSTSEYLWPLGHSRTLGDDSFWRFLLLYGDNFDTRDPDARYRTVLFPLLFWGRDAKREKYFAIFPLGGKLHEYLMCDKITFAMFPLYAHTQKKSLETYSYLWPIVSSTKGDGIRRFRVFPFYGKSVNRDKWTKTFVLWPFWNSARYNYPQSKGHAYVLFPLFGRINLSDQQGWMVVPPFIRWTKSAKETMVNCPWPFIQYVSGAEEKLYLWPLWGHKELGPVKSSFYLWPIGHYKQVERPRYTLTRAMVLPFVYYESKVARASASPGAKSLLGQLGDNAAGTNTAGTAAEVNRSEVEGRVDVDGLSPFLVTDRGDSAANDGVRQSLRPGVRPDDGAALTRDARSATIATNAHVVLSRYFKLWPLLSYRREGDVVRWRALELWPLKDTAAVDRSWAPFWTLYTQGRMRDASDQEWLWGLYRRRVEASGARRWSLFPLIAGSASADRSARQWTFLMGLLGHEQEGLRRRWRLLYFMRFGPTAPPPGDSSDDLASSGGRAPICSREGE